MTRIMAMIANQIVKKNESLPLNTVMTKSWINPQNINVMKIENVDGNIFF